MQLKQIFIDNLSRSLWQYFTTGDKMLLLFLLIISLISMGTGAFLREIGQTVVVEVNGGLAEKIELHRNARFEVHGPCGVTTVSVKNGSVRILDSDCPHKLCVKMGAAKHAGDTIVCVPNRVVIRVLGRKDNEFDLITE